MSYNRSSEEAVDYAVISGPRAVVREAKHAGFIGRPARVKINVTCGCGFASQSVEHGIAHSEATAHSISISGSIVVRN